jgi:DNA-binding NtrC family response regulator
MSAEFADRTGNGPTSSGPQAPQLLGWSGTMRNVQHLIEAVSDTDVPVLIRGNVAPGKISWHAQFTSLPRGVTRPL